MSDRSSPPPDAADAIDALTARLWPTLSKRERRERARLALGLIPVAPWTEGRMVYVEAPDR